MGCGCSNLLSLQSAFWQCGSYNHFTRHCQRQGSSWEFRHKGKEMAKENKETSLNSKHNIRLENRACGFQFCLWIALTLSLDRSFHSLSSQGYFYSGPEILERAFRAESKWVVPGQCQKAALGLEFMDPSFQLAAPSPDPWTVSSSECIQKDCIQFNKRLWSHNHCS